MNEIVEKQNQKSSIEKLFAQRKIYSEAKFILYARFMMALLLAVFVPIVGIMLPDKKIYLAIFSVVYLIIEFLLEKIEKNKKSNATKIQEFFDTEVFGLGWNFVVAGKKPEQELISGYILKSSEKDLEALKNWYPKNISTLPRNYGIIICQKSNVWWDSDLRKKLILMLYLLLSLISLIIIIFNLNTTLGNFIIGILPVVPLYKVIINQIISYGRSIIRLNHLKEKLDYMVENTQQESVSDTGLRLIQDEIYRHRMESQSVPDLFYKIFRNKSEKIMNLTAEQLIEKFLHVNKIGEKI